MKSRRRPDISLMRMSARQRLVGVVPLWILLAALVAWALAAP